MNERIKELAKEYFCRTEYDNGNVHECYEFSEEELDKFAELIVRECCAAISDTDRYRSDYFIAKIKQHFGVEVNEEIVSKGITKDYVWYEAKTMLAKIKAMRDQFKLAEIKALQDQLKEFVSTMSQRDKENKQVIAKLYAENFQMNQEIKDLKEKAKNGPIT
jgi:hypothetical protein